MCDYIFKIYRPTEWQNANTQSAYAGSSDDKRDGFIHFSTRKQLASTIQKHFTSETRLYIAMYKTSDFSEQTLRWEKSRGNALFPHLYQTLNKNSHCKHWVLERDHNGTYDYSDIPED